MFEIDLSQLWEKYLLLQITLFTCPQFVCGEELKEYKYFIILNSVQGLYKFRYEFYIEY